jgi:hypothetical protein
VQHSGPGWLVVATTTQPIRVAVNEQLLNSLKLQANPPQPPSAVSVALLGDADLSIVQKGMGVTFSAELEQGKGTGEITELTLFTPSKATPLSLMATGGAESSGSPTGQFLVSGEVRSFNKGQLIVLAPNEHNKPISISVAVADSAKVKSRLGDVSFAQKGDLVKIDGYLISKANVPTNTMLAQTVEVTLSKPLMSTQKRRELAANRRDSGKKSSGKSSPTRKASDAAETEGKNLLPFADAESKASAVEPAAKMEEKAEKQAGTRQPGDPTPAALIITDEFSVDATTLFDK